MLDQNLRKMGLSDGEIQIYKALINNGNAPVNTIHEKTGIERRNIYDILNKLIGKGLITYVTENKRRTFAISHPTKLIGYIEEKSHGLERIKEEIKKELPQLLEKYKETRTKITAEVFRGPEGIKAVWEDMLSSDGIYWIGSGRYIPKRFPVFISYWNKKRVEKKIKLYNLLRYELRNKFKIFPLEDAKFLPKEFSGNPTVICIYGNKVVNFLLGEEYFAFVIESKELAEDNKKYHAYLWNHVAKE